MLLRPYNFAFAVLLLVLLALPGTSLAIDLTGTWDFTFTMNDDSSPDGSVTLTDTCNLRQNGYDLEGEVLYGEGDKTFQEPITGTVDVAGNVEFTLQDADLTIPHTGTVSNQGNTIKGEWTLEGVTWPFEMTRK